MKTKLLLIACIFVVIIFFTAVTFVVASYQSGDGQADGGKMRVVVTIVPLAEFVEKVGGDRVLVTIMVPPGASPHTYEPTPGQLINVSDSEIYFKVGSGVEFELTWMDNILELNKNMSLVDCSKGIELIENDPHIWLSPVNAITMVENIYDGLVQIDPNNASYYQQNKDAYISDLNRLDLEINQSLSGIENRNLMVYHPSWGYFCRDYGMKQFPIEDEGKEPTAEGLANLIDQAMANEIEIIFVSPEFSQASAQTVADQIGASVVLISPLSKDYVNNLRLR